MDRVNSGEHPVMELLQIWCLNGSLQSRTSSYTLGIGRCYIYIFGYYGRGLGIKRGTGHSQWSEVS